MTATAQAPARPQPARSRTWRPLPLALAALVVLALALRVNAALEPLDVRSGSDADVYGAIAEHLYETGSFGLPDSSSPYDFSPGAPLFYAGVYTAIGAADPTAARLVVAVIGALTVLLVFLIGRRLGGTVAGLAGAALWAIYPVSIFYTGKLMSEPLACLTLAAAVLAFLWAADRPREWWAWAAPGVLLGLTALLRPEYLAFSAVFALLALLRAWRSAGARPALAGTAVLLVAFAAPVAPWTVHVSGQEDRFVPISTGGGKATFIGTYLPGNGLHLDVKRELLARQRGRTDVGVSELAATSMTPLLDRVAARYPDLPRDAALQRIGRENAERYLREQPGAFGRMIASKMWHMWQGSGAAGRSTYGSVVQYAVLALALAGLVLLALRRRFAVLPLAALVLGITVVGGLLLAGTRRNVPLMPLMMAAAGVAVAAAVQRARSGGSPR